jgi:hypothetical protein
MSGSLARKELVERSPHITYCLLDVQEGNLFFE